MQFVRACRLLAMLSLIHGAAGGFASANVPIEKTCAKIARLSDGLVRVRVVHLSNQIETFAAIGPHELLKFPRAQTLVIRDANTLARIVALVRASRPTYRGGPRGFDARWGLAFENRDGSIVPIFANRFGSEGEIDGVPVRFAGSPFADRLPALLPMLER